MIIVARCFNCDRLIWLPTKQHYVPITATIGKNKSQFTKNYCICRPCQQRIVLGDNPK